MGVEEARAVKRREQEMKETRRKREIKNLPTSEEVQNPG